MWLGRLVSAWLNSATGLVFNDLPRFVLRFSRRAIVKRKLRRKWPCTLTLAPRKFGSATVLGRSVSSGWERNSSRLHSFARISLRKSSFPGRVDLLLARLHA